MVHRVNNILAVVIGLFHQTARTNENVQQLATTFNGRLLAMAAANTAVIRSSGEKVLLGDLVAVQLGPFLEARRIPADGPVVMLPTTYAQPIALAAELTRPKGTRVADLWPAYIRDKDGRAILTTMVHTWKALKDRFGPMAADAITVQDCRAHVAERRKAGIKDGTIHTELGHLRMVLRWAEKQGTIRKASFIERPSKPKPKEEHLSRQQARALINAAPLPHLRLYTILALGTGARNAALLDLTWDRCDFDRGLIDLRNPEITTPHKGRAIVPMNRTVQTALLETSQGALTKYVIERAGNKLGSVKRGLASAAKRAGIAHASPHMLRHSAAVHMAEAGVTMDEIAQYLGHDDVKVTRRTYARFSPDYLRGAATALEYDDIGSLNLRELRKGPLSHCIDGGRDRDRTCDPYDVNVVMALFNRANGHRALDRRS
jgi:integrase